MEEIKKYKIAKRVFIGSAAIYSIFVVFTRLRLPTEFIKQLIAFFDEHPNVLNAVAFLALLPLSAALVSLGLMLKYKHSRYMRFRFSLYFVAGVCFVFTLLQLIVYAFLN